MSLDNTLLGNTLVSYYIGLSLIKDFNKANFYFTQTKFQLI